MYHLLFHHTRPLGYKTFSMLNSAEHEIYHAHKVNVKMPHLRDLKQEASSFAGILVFMSRWNFVLIWVRHEKSSGLSKSKGFWMSFNTWNMPLYESKSQSTWSACTLLQLDMNIWCKSIVCGILFFHMMYQFLFVCLFVLLLYVPSQQLWSLRYGQFT